MARGGRSLLALVMLAFAGVGSYYAWTGPDSPLAERVPLTVVATTSPTLPAESPASSPPEPVAPEPRSPAPAAVAVEPSMAPPVEAPPVEVTTSSPVVEVEALPKRESPQPTEPSPRIVTVSEGDTLYSIAQAELGSGARWREIADANPGIDPGSLRVGDRLVLPRPLAGGPPSIEIAEEIHVVAPGETLTSIARARWNDGARWRRLLEANESLLGGDPDRLRVGDRLVVPAVR
ncbi:MAG: LysM peptidoglycan-binding domain-containing protein [Phycisphaerae bacterium]|nr:LysM peptidoglycan-binding domain-containing protein [Phycisphaerae bacterium]